MDFKYIIDHIYTYIYIHICVYIHIYIYTYIYIYIYTYIYIYICIYICIYIYMCTDICMYLLHDTNIIYVFLNTTWKQEAFFENDTHGDIPLKIWRLEVLQTSRDFRLFWSWFLMGKPQDWPYFNHHLSVVRLCQVATQFIQDRVNRVLYVFPQSSCGMFFPKNWCQDQLFTSST